MINLRGIPTSECPVCESRLFNIRASFDDSYEICGYLLDCECAVCNTLLTAPTPLDHPNYEESL